MFSWYSVSVSTWPPANVIIVCISSSKLAEGVPTATPSDANGNGPVKALSKSVMSSCWSITARLRFCWAGLMAASCAW